MKPLLDTSVLDDLKELSPEEPMQFLQELFQAYQTQAQPDLVQLKREQADNNWIGVSKIAHRLKSASAQLGALRVGELAQALETLTKSGQSDPQVPELIAELTRAFQESEILFIAYFKKT